MDPGGEVMRQVVDAVAAGNGQQLLRDGALLERARVLAMVEPWWSHDEQKMEQIITIIIIYYISYHIA